MNQTYSLKTADTIITVASWEPRFILGLKQLLPIVKPKQVHIFYYSEYLKWSQDNIVLLKELCSNQNIDCISTELFLDKPGESWITMHKYFQSIEEKLKNICLDITTMPREAIWNTLFLIKEINKDCIIQYSYFKPEDYGDWLSADPKRPRLIYKMSGVTKLNRSQTLLIMTGFDVQRTKRLIRMYEPENIIIGTDSGTEFENIAKNRESHKEALTRNKDIHWFEADHYDTQEVIEKVSEEIKPFLDSNIIMSSLGPKPGTIGLFNVYSKNKNLAISYAPAREYNRDYSYGIGDWVAGII